MRGLISNSYPYMHTCIIVNVQITVSAQNPTSATAAAGYLSRPDDITVAVGEPAIFHCGVPEASPNITFTFYGGHGNYSLTCPQGHVEDILQVRWCISPSSLCSPFALSAQVKLIESFKSENIFSIKIRLNNVHLKWFF